MANFLAMDQDLEIVPILNKIDLPAADPDKVALEVEESLGLPAEDYIPASAKKGIGVPEILTVAVENAAPTGDPKAPLKALIFDAVYDDYRGIIVYFRIVDGAMRKGDTIKFARKFPKIPTTSPKLPPSPSHDRQQDALPPVKSAI